MPCSGDGEARRRPGRGVGGGGRWGAARVAPWETTRGEGGVGSLSTKILISSNIRDNLGLGSNIENDMWASLFNDQPDSMVFVEIGLHTGACSN